jgi:hypothetical protein
MKFPDFLLRVAWVLMAKRPRHRPKIIFRWLPQKLAGREWIGFI